MSKFTSKPFLTLSLLVVLTFCGASFRSRRPVQPVYPNAYGQTVTDPHFTGIDGGKYDFMGSIGGTYNFLSDKNVQVNGTMKIWKEDPLGQRPAWMEYDDGSCIGEMGIRFA